MTEPIIPGGEETPKPLSYPERRATLRHRINRDARCYPYQGDRYERHEAELRDVSLSGLGLVTNQAFPVGERLILDLPRRIPGFPYGLSVRVARVVSLDSGHWFIGCEFTKPITRRALQALLP